ncbi:MAG TPA: DoxX family membrane protein, partial [Roseivirga sp.]
STSKTKQIVNWVLRVIPALIMLQTLFFKFTGAEESVYIFTQIGMEPWGRYLVGSTELVAGILLFTSWYGFGALLAIGAMSGAIFFHLTKLGIEIKGDGGYLFALALVVFICSALLVLINFQEIKTKLLSIIK